MKCGFFNSVNGDRKYDADDISNYFLKLISNGVFATPSNSMQVQAAGGMKIKVTPGWAFVNCKWLRLDTDYYITLDKSDVQYNRLDRIVVRLDPTESVRSVTIAVKKGTASSPTKIVPLTRVKNGIWELSLGQVWVMANATEIRQSNIIDERGNTDVCGWVTGLIDQIDTTSLFAQYDDAFKESLKHNEDVYEYFIDESKYQFDHELQNMIDSGNQRFDDFMAALQKKADSMPNNPEPKDDDDKPETPTPVTPTVVNNIDEQAVGNLIKTTLAKFIPMLFGYYCEVLDDWDFFHGYLNGYGISREVYDINNGDVVMIWHNGELLMNKEDYFLTGGDPKFWRVVDEQKRYGGQLTIQVWHPPVKNTSIFDDEPTVIKVEKKVASLSGSASNEIYSSPTETIAKSSSASVSGSSVKTISGKSEKVTQ